MKSPILLGIVLAAQVVMAHAAADSPVAERGGAIVAAPPVEVRASVARTPARLTGVAASRRVALAPPGARELSALIPSTTADKRDPLVIGIGRQVADAIALADLTWQTNANGARTARIELASPGAAALRLELELENVPGGVVMRFAGSHNDEAFTSSARDIARESRYWSPVLSGDTATIEFEVPQGVALANAVVRVSRLSHIVVDGVDLLAPAAPVARASGIGASGTCNIDVACIAAANPPAAALARSVAKLSFIRETDGRTLLCTGTLLADTVGSGTPYLFSANHCLDSQARAETLNTYWFFAATTCNSKVSPQFVQLTSGAKLLGRSPDNDWSLMRLNETPPPGTVLAGWRAEPLAAGSNVITVHHPAGDLAKFSSGQVTNDVELVDELVHGNFAEVVWGQGVTEGGSSGGLLATLATGGSFYEVRGALYEGSSACGLFAHSPDYYSHLTSVLPLVRQYLTPNASNANATIVAVEFYNALLDHYFLSTNPIEIDNLDSGRTVGWVRTGLRFQVYDHQAPGTNPVCRFYRAPAFGDSHFFSASPQECAQTAAAHPVDWIYESPGVFYVYLPDVTSGACPAGTSAVYRYFNSRTTNHRYTTERVIRDEMTAAPSVWTAEGYGPGPYFPVMCVVTQ